jgi:hypothetical protein
MATIGREEYPELSLSEALAITERVGRENVRTANSLAVVMGLRNSDSGWFYHKVSALTKYFGLVERTKGNVSLTPLGERIAHPLSDSDRISARAEAAQRVTLLRSLYTALGPSYHDADFRTKLRDVTQAPLAEIEKHANAVEQLYRDSIQYFAMGGGTSLNMPAAIASPQPHTTPSEAAHGGSRVISHEPGYRTFEGDGVYLKVKKDRDALEEARVTIEGWIKLHVNPGTTRATDSDTR